ncbi:MAG TPA: hypothetical protein V6D03_05400, partial [Candidatus Caenarcaniphilales bacterium]
MSQADAPISSESKLPEAKTSKQSAFPAMEAAPAPSAPHFNPLTAFSQPKAASPALEISHRMLQYQQNLIESLTEQLASSQAHLAQLELQLASVQQRYEEKSQLLQQSEATCQDLRTRLGRQQQQTLQFKTALERCLETTPVPNQSNLDQPLNAA